MRKASDRWALNFAVILLVPLLLGTTYSWVDVTDTAGASPDDMRCVDALFQLEALSPGCREAREKLQNLQRPTAHSTPSNIEQQQSYIAAHCPDVSRDGVWLADWIWVRHP